MVCKLYHIKVVLDDDYGIAFVDELLQDIHQYAYVLEVKSRCRLVEYVEGLAGIFLSQFRCELHSLALASRECCRRLSELYVPQSNLLQRRYLLRY